MFIMYLASVKTRSLSKTSRTPSRSQASHGAVEYTQRILKVTSGIPGPGAVDYVPYFEVIFYIFYIFLRPLFHRSVISEM